MTNKNKTTIKKILILFIVSITLFTSFYIFLFRNDITFAIKENLTKKDKIEITPRAFEDNFDYLNLRAKNINRNNNLILINKNYSLENLNVKENLKEYKNTGLLIDFNLENSLDLLIADSTFETKENLFIMSSFRDHKEQNDLYLNDPNHAQKPYHSEHETGLALDFYTNNFAGRNILKSDIGKFLYKESYRYGFILRYPLFKKHITGISYEPWHFRYIGQPHAEIIYKKRFTLEEYLEELKKDDYFIFEDFYISYQKEYKGKIKVLKHIKNISISEDNKEGYIITGNIE